MDIYNVDPIEDDKGINYYGNSELKNVYINNLLICYFWCISRKNNINKLLFEEGSKLLTEKLDILNKFNQSYITETKTKAIRN